MIVVGIMFFLATSISAEIYRHVDAEGNVTYTDEVPVGAKDAEEVILPPSPSSESISETETRNQRMLRAADQADKKRLEQRRKKQATIAMRKSELEKAEKRLEEAKVIKDDDRQNLVGGKSPIHPDYFARVKAAKEEVEKARKALQKARGY
jgi:hypothetical protein